MMNSLNVTVGLRNYRIIPSAKVERIDCDCAKGEIVCPRETTLRELDDVISSVSAHEMPAMRRIPLVGAS
jgi:hypothetical protein